MTTATTPETADGWITCDHGHAHWGLAGAAGLLLRHVDAGGIARYLMQLRAAHVHHGNTWSTLGGALHFGEQPEVGALREATEEFGCLPSMTVVCIHADDHGGWTYSTVVADVPYFAPSAHAAHDGESLDHRWCTAEEIDSLALHPGFASMWQQHRHSF